MQYNDPVLGGSPLFQRPANAVMGAMQGMFKRRARPFGTPPQDMDISALLGGGFPPPQGMIPNLRGLGGGGIPQMSLSSLRSGLLDLLHPNVPSRIAMPRGSLIGARRAIDNSVPQPNLKTAVPADGPFHHSAFAGNGTDKRAQLAAIRQQHIQEAQAQAGQMANAMSKARARGFGRPRRATYGGY